MVNFPARNQDRVMYKTARFKVYQLLIIEEYMSEDIQVQNTSQYNHGDYIR